MACLISYNIAQAFNESSITDETLLQFAKGLYKEGFIKANIEYDMVNTIITKLQRNSYSYLIKVLS